MAILFQCVAQTCDKVECDCVGIEEGLMAGISGLLAFDIVAIDTLHGGGHGHGETIGFHLGHVEVRKDQMAVPEHLFEDLIFLCADNFLFHQKKSSSLLAGVAAPAAGAAATAFFASMMRLSMKNRVRAMAAPITAMPRLLRPRLLAQIKPTK